jgi:hypothetical protein
MAAMSSPSLASDAFTQMRVAGATGFAARIRRWTLRALESVD